MLAWDWQAHRTRPEPTARLRKVQRHRGMQEDPRMSQGVLATRPGFARRQLETSKHTRLEPQTPWRQVKHQVNTLTHIETCSIMSSIDPERISLALNVKYIQISSHVDGCDAILVRRGTQMAGASRSSASNLQQAGVLS